MYGETSFDLVDQMIKSINFSEDDYFIDLGSGEWFPAQETLQSIVSISVYMYLCLPKFILNKNHVNHIKGKAYVQKSL